MPVPDAHTRNRISLKPSKVFSTSIPNRFIPRILLANVLFVFAVHASKEWLLSFDVGVFWVLMRVLACGGLGVLVWEGLTGQFAKRREIEWSVLGTASLLQFMQYGSLLVAVYRLSCFRIVLFTHFSTYWLGSLLNLSSPRKATITAAALLLSIGSDTTALTSNFWHFAPGYGALLLHAIISIALEHTLSVLSPSLGTTFTTAASTLGATIFALPFYLFRSVVLDFPSTPALPLVSLAAIPVIAYSFLFLSPLTQQSVKQHTLQPQHFGLSYPSLMFFSLVLGIVVFRETPSWTDLFVGSLLYVGMYPENIETITSAPRAPAARLIKSYLKTILSNPESRKIFYFLVLNLCFMGVQMLYGVWTNSLGLISDAIHMAFDCMAIGVGLLASVMATWDPNERFTYGYGRIETLSGFANGIFLILISIFIIFEAIQRILEPPEMNTSQLLLVSSLGLGVNLFGMFAMGGHHHGGHSHSHGHSNSHSVAEKPHSGHSHSPPPPISLTLSHDHSQAGHSHSHSISPPAMRPSSSTHSRSHSLAVPAIHTHSPPHSPVDCHDHDHDHGHSHSHSPIQPSHGHQHHSHSHDDSGHHGHSHSPTHNPILTSNQSAHGHSHSHAAHSHGTQDKSRRAPPVSAISVELANSIKGTPGAQTPLTPLYTFGHDDHFEKHHESKHTPNLHNHSHAHGHAHEGHSHNMRGVFLHVMADTLGSVGVIISTLLIQFYGWTGFDPIASLFIAILIAASVVPLVLDTGKVLALDVGERDVDVQKALTELSSIEGLASYTSPRFWPKDSSSLIGSIRIQLAPSASSVDPTGPHSSRGMTYTKLDRVVERVDALLREKITGLEELTIQVEGKHGLFSGRSHVLN